MDRCPTCRARVAGKTVCHRCRTDLAPLIEIENRASDHYREAVNAWRQGDAPRMFTHARRSCILGRTPAAVRLLACAALLCGKFDLAVSIRNR